MSGSFSKSAYLIKAAVGFAFLAVLSSFVQGNELLSLLTRIDWLYFALSFLLVPVMLSTSCLKWKMLLDVREPKIPFFSLLRIYLIGYFFSNLLPSNVGGDVVRSFYAGRLINSQAYAAVSVFVERFSGILFLILLVIVSPLFRPGLYASPYVLVPAAGAAVLLGVIVWVWMVRDPLRLPERIMEGLFAALHGVIDRTGMLSARPAVQWGERLSARIFSTVARFHEELTRAVTVIRHDRRLFVGIITVTVFFYFLTWVNVYISFRAFGVAPDFLAVCALVPTIMFVGHLPLSVLGNLGFFESVFVFYFLLIQIPPAESLAMGLLLRLKMLSLGAVGYLVYLSYKQHRAHELELLQEFARRKKDAAGQG